jgi:hypothetical protein
MDAGEVDHPDVAVSGVEGLSRETERALAPLSERLERIEAILASMLQQRDAKAWYTPAEAGALLGKAEFTVREWCRLGRIRAEKRPCGRGASQEWIIAREEIQRFREEGLLPNPAKYRHYR